MPSTKRMPSEYSVAIGTRTCWMCSRARGRRPLHRVGQRLAQYGDRVIGHDQGELAVGGRRVEVGRRREEPLGGRADRLDLLGELLPERGQHVLAVLTDQQLVAEVPAQPGQRRAGGRLRHPEPLRGPGDAALPDQLAQRHEQVQVKVGQVGDGAHNLPIKRPARPGGKIPAVKTQAARFREIASARLPVGSSPAPDAGACFEVASAPVRLLSGHRTSAAASARLVPLHRLPSRPRCLASGPAARPRSPGARAACRPAARAAPPPGAARRRSAAPAPCAVPGQVRGRGLRFPRRRPCGFPVCGGAAFASLDRFIGGWPDYCVNSSA